MKHRRTYQVSEVSQISGISVRTLHHYHEIGLLVPRARTRAGYRLYDDFDLLRLQQILISRQFGLSLEQIRHTLNDPQVNHHAQLAEQRSRLVAQVEDTQRMIRAIDAALAELDNPGGTPMKSLFEGFDPAQYESETQSRWGESAAYKESARRTQSYTAEDWATLKAEQSSVHQAAKALLDAGQAPDCVASMDIAERHRLFIDRWFYPCTFSHHEGLASLYESDLRFRDNIDAYGAGLTQFLCAAIRANARRGE